MPESKQKARGMNPARTIRKLARQTEDEARKALFEQLAAEMEAFENRLNNNFQAALGLTELHLTERLDALEQLLLRHLEKVGDNDASNAARQADDGERR